MTCFATTGGKIAGIYFNASTKRIGGTRCAPGGSSGGHRESRVGTVLVQVRNRVGGGRSCAKSVAGRVHSRQRTLALWSRGDSRSASKTIIDGGIGQATRLACRGTGRLGKCDDA